MYRQTRDAVADALRAALAEREWPTDDLGIERPPEDVDAVVASSVAFRLAEVAQAPPPAVAEQLAGDLDADAIDYVGEVVAAGPYVNFHPSERYVADTVAAARDPDYGQLPPRDTSVVLEHTSANPTGPVHVGRARNPIVGDALSRVLSYAGYDVDVHYYVNDAGRQVATFTWAYETIDEGELDPPEREKADYDLVRYYRAGNTFLEEGPEDEVAAAEDEIQSIMQGLESGEEATYERVSEVVDTVLGGMRQTLERLPATFDEFVKETRFLQNGATDELASRLENLEAAIYDEDAWQLDLADHGIEKNLVFRRSDGTSLYATRDLAHHEWKLDNYDRAITVLGEDHRLQADQVRATLDLLGHDTDRLDQVLYSFVDLPEGSMSTRQGTGVDLDDLLDEAVARAREEVEDRMGDRIRNDDLDESDVDRIARQVGVGAVRYDVVSKQPTKAITFEWDRALDFEAQSAPYVQYVHARCCGILGEAGVDVETLADELPGALPADVDPGALDTAAERDLIRVLARFPAVIEQAAEEHRPHVVATYTRDLAEAFNAFYRECPVLNAADEATREARLALVGGTRNAVANALDAVGVAAPRSM